jgi:Holliday junction resolvase RusA-like endonuclease
MTTLAFTIPGEPRGKGRPRATSRGGFTRLYTDKKTASYENLVALAAREALAGREPLDEPVGISIRVRLCPAASLSNRKREAMLSGAEHPTKKPDLDNVVKAVMDGCNAVAFRDDALVVRQTASKVYARVPGVDVVITTIKEAA